MNDILTIIFIIAAICWMIFSYIHGIRMNKRLDDIDKRLYLFENPYKYQISDIVQFKNPDVEMPDMIGIITYRRVIGEETFGKLYEIFVEKEKNTFSMPENYIIGLAK